MTYEKFIQQIRGLAREGEVRQVEKMLCLVELRQLEALWATRYKSWGDLLTKEKLGCTATLFVNFQKSLTRLSEKDVRCFGVRASARIGQLPAKLQSQVITQTRDWWKTYNVPPEYQLVTQFVSKLVPRKEKQPKVAEGILLRHIYRLNRMLKANGILPPKMPPF